MYPRLPGPGTGWLEWRGGTCVTPRLGETLSSSAGGASCATGRAGGHHTHGMAAGAFIEEHGLVGLTIVLHGECQGGLCKETAGPWLGDPVTRSEQPVISELFPHLLETQE